MKKPSLRAYQKPGPVGFSLLSLLGNPPLNITVFFYNSAFNFFAYVLKSILKGISRVFKYVILCNSSNTSGRSSPISKRREELKLRGEAKHF